MSTFPMFQIYQDFFKKKSMKVRCPEDMMWLQEYLQKKHLKAYRVNISIDDVKKRTKENEISDWCNGDSLRIWRDKSF